MDNTGALNRKLETAAWGLFFVWWGVAELFKFLPHGADTLGIGLILLGLNTARSLNGIPTSSFTIILGIITFVWGGLELAGSLLSLPYEIPVFGISLIALGLSLLVRELLKGRDRGQEQL